MLILLTNLEMKVLYNTYLLSLTELEDEMEKCKVFVEGKSDNQEERLSDV